MTDPEKAETAELPALTETITDPVILNEMIEVLKEEVSILRTENAALHRERAEEKQIAEEILDAKRDEEDLKKRSKAAKERAEHLSEALMARTRGDVQTDIGDIKDPADPMANQQPINWTPEDEIKARAAAGDVLHIKGIKWSGQSALSRMHSLGKPPKVAPLEMIDGSPFPGGSFIIYDVRESDRVAFLRPLLDKAQWASAYDFPPKDLPNSYATAELDSLGMDAGCPVKVGRKTMYIGDMKDVMCVAIPPGEKIEEAASDEPEEAADTGPDEDPRIVGYQDRADETPSGNVDYTLIANRIRGYIEGLAGEDRRVSEVARALNLSPAMVHAAAAQALSFYDEHEDNPIIEV